MRISDWSSDVCSSDLLSGGRRGDGERECAGHRGRSAPGFAPQPAVLYVRFAQRPAPASFPIVGPRPLLAALSRLTRKAKPGIRLPVLRSRNISAGARSDQCSAALFLAAGTFEAPGPGANGSA